VVMITRRSLAADLKFEAALDRGDRLT